MQDENYEVYNPTDNEQKLLTHVYSEYEEMRDTMEREYREMNDRTPRQFWDDSQKRANGYVPSRASQGKEDWQANVFTKYTRNKIKNHIAGVAKQPPVIRIRAINEKNQLSHQRAEVMRLLVNASYLEGDDNPETVIIKDSWDCATNGTVIKFDGYLRTKGKVRMIESFDPITGKLEIETQEAEIEDRPIEVPVPLQNFFVKNAYISNIQEQPSIIWVKYYTKEAFNEEFGKYQNAQNVHTGQELTKGEQELFFGEHWVERYSQNMIEVVRYFNKSKDQYIIIANGVVLLDAPLLWGRRKKKYPFAKTVFEMFANSNFFWGNSLPNILMDDQDVANAFINSMIDKTYRTLTTPLLIGMGNKDAFELEDESVTMDTKIYVDDINQVKPMPIDAVSPSEIQMLNIVRRGLEEASTDSVQGGTAGSGSTAREIVIANERADELKGLFFSMLKDLWLQKNRLRVLNILMNYNRPKKVETLAGVDGRETFYAQFKSFQLPQAELSSGEQGLIQVDVVGGREQLPSSFETSVREEVARMHGSPMEIITITSDYLDEWEYFLEVESESLYQSRRALDQALEVEKITTVANLFPDIFMANKNEFFKTLMRKYNDDPEKYLQSAPQETMMPQQSPTPQLAAQMTSANKQLPSLGSLV